MQLIEQAQTLLNFDNQATFDVNILDAVINTMYRGQGDAQRQASEVLNILRDHPDAWTKVDCILEYSKCQETKYYALQILEKTIKIRWKTLPKEQCEAIKQFIVSMIISHSQNQQSIEREKVYLSKLNIILVQILKHEWPKNWPNFISDIVEASKTNESMCQNNLEILKLLSEEVFDFSSGQMTQTKAKHLKDTMCTEFTKIFQLCEYVVDKSRHPPLLLVTLETLLRFLSWIPLGYIFETNMANTLIETFFTVPMFRNVTLRCLTEIASIQISQYESKLIEFFRHTMIQLKTIMPLTIDLKSVYRTAKDDDQKFIQNLALFLAIFLKEHGLLIERTPDLKETLLEALQYLVFISEVDDIEIFKICLEYWNILSSELYREVPYQQTALSYMRNINNTSSRRQFYSVILSKVRRVMISRMARPEEVLIVENERGEVVREFMKDTDAINLYKNMRETLVYLTHLNYLDTESIMTEKLANQINGSEWSWKNLNTLCWAIGSISGAMVEDDEKRFLVTVIKELLGLVEQKRGKDNKAIVASNIMYVVGQYPRFLRAHWKFLKTVVNKLFEFMHETHEGVQDMACDTFIKISQKCRRHFITIQLGESQPFVEEILTNINGIICHLEAHQLQTFYEAVGHMIAASIDIIQQTKLIDKYMQLPNEMWNTIIFQAKKSVECLKDPDIINNILNILKTNIRASKALGAPYVHQLIKIYQDMLHIYKVTSENINQAIRIHGSIVVKQRLIKSMMAIKEDTLILIGNYFSKANNTQQILDEFFPPLITFVLIDYRDCHSDARESEVLNLLAILVNKAENRFINRVPEVFDLTFEHTLHMIDKNFEDYPDHRKNFYIFLQSVANVCFPALIALNATQFKFVYDSIMWALKHTMRTISELGLEILQTMIRKFQTCDPQAAQNFYQVYYLETMQHIFAVVAECSHTSGLTAHSQILANLFLIAEQGLIKIPLAPEVQDPSQNLLYIQQFMANLLKTAFSHLQDNQIKVIIEGFVALDQDIVGFKEHLRDFLVQIRETNGNDTADLYLEDREQTLKLAAEEKRKIQMSVPGILNPHEIPEDMQD
ncbi:unnamed protein product [Adineta steineri]|uniref:Importin N-terminal domain-containing protein n=1 Tax=Adineta steineri TaxID=433720 RepID=A0A818H874_9BILA|nr:unnamed protein product [Adineta steineri]CAF3504125.1 unnamed protein product [Adineta steineri]